MRAYKGFHKDLNCTMGKGVFYYEPGKWYRGEGLRKIRKILEHK